MHNYEWRDKMAELAEKERCLRQREIREKSGHWGLGLVSLVLRVNGLIDLRYVCGYLQNYLLPILCGKNDKLLLAMISGKNDEKGEKGRPTISSRTQCGAGSITTPNSTI
jgi:hypothetical protein